jgi:hypothetical protein
VCDSAEAGLRQDKAVGNLIVVVVDLRDKERRCWELDHLYTEHDLV